MSYTYDANGHLWQRQYFDARENKQTQALGWDGAGRLSLAFQEAGANDIATVFTYDAEGQRTTQTEVPGTTSFFTTVYPFPFYEVTYDSATSVYTSTRYYLFNGESIALRVGAEDVTYLQRDQVGSIALTTRNGAVVDSRQYFAYGTKRGGDDYPFEPDYTGQRRDGTGLMYYNARYYDPQLGMFISPDTIIPDPGDIFSYNRYSYGRGNPVSNNDPTGHCAEAYVIANPMYEGC